MPLNSMTGFARGAGSNQSYQWNWEIKSVNNKGLDVRTKLPFLLDGYDIELKKIISHKITRGSVFVSLTLEKTASTDDLVINEDKLNTLLGFAVRYKDTPGVAAPSLDGLLSIKGVLETVSDTLNDEERSTLEAALSDTIIPVIDALLEARRSEGERIGHFLHAQLAEIKKLTAQARRMSGDRIVAMQTRFKNQLAKLLQADTSLSEERLAQEMAVIAVKADIQEELDRLESHIAEATNLLTSGKPAGRRLDFLCQEFNREANTLCSKSSDTTLTKIGIDLKTIIDQFREQIQNIE